MDTGYPWTVDQYQATPLPLTATRSERIEAMIGYAWNQTGSSYTWGGQAPTTRDSTARAWCFSPSMLRAWIPSPST